MRLPDAHLRQQPRALPLMPMHQEPLTPGVAQGQHTEVPLGSHPADRYPQLPEGCLPRHRGIALLPLEFLLKPLPMAIELAGAIGGGAPLPGAECQLRIQSLPHHQEPLRRCTAPSSAAKPCGPPARLIRLTPKPGRLLVAAQCSSRSGLRLILS